jgi:asparagine synthetase B (glutamine-hydrolysing)
MCGIHAIISPGNAAEISQNLRQALSNRGPDYLGQVTRSVSTADAQESNVSITFTSTVLALRGDHVAKQPFHDSELGSVLCWNGEAWKIDDQVVKGNDGEAIFAKLASSNFTDAEQRKSHTLSVLRSIQGPFAFVFYDAICKRLYYGRDRLGRRSLLINNPPNGQAISVSSIADALTPEWKEVEANGIYSMDINSHSLHQMRIEKDPWLPSGGADLVSARRNSPAAVKPGMMTLAGVEYWQV